MTHEAPLSPRPLSHLPEANRSVMTACALREHGVTPAMAAERCRPGGPWRMLLPGVCLLHTGEPTSEERLRAALLYAAGEAVPALAGPGRSPMAPGGDQGVAPEAELPEDAMITGLAALALYHFTAAPTLLALDRIDVLVSGGPRGRTPRSTGCARIVRARALPEPEEITGLPVAPVPRALADAVRELGDTDALVVRRLLTESVRGGHCEAQAVVRELARAGLLARAHVVDAVDAVLAEGRALAEGWLYEMVHRHGLPDPCWNVELRVPGGPPLGCVDVFWPDHAVAVEIDTRMPHLVDAGSDAGPEGTRAAEAAEAATVWSAYARRRDALERLGITVVHVTPHKLRDALDQQAAVVRTALMTSAERDPATPLTVLPR